MNHILYCPSCSRELKLTSLTRASKEPVYVCESCDLKHIVRSHKIYHKGYTLPESQQR